RWRGRESPPPSSSPTAGHDMVPLRIAVEDSKIDIGDFFKGDLPKKFLMLLGLLALSRVGIYIPLWGVDISAFQEQLGEGSFLATLDTLSGGGIGRLGLFSLGIVPYINAQIVFQLLGTLYPKIGDLQKKEGEAGRKKAQQYMKYMAVAFGALQEAERRFFYLPANVALIAFFNYFYTFLQLDPADVSDQLKRQGASVPNTRPGKATAALITKVLTRISVLGSAFLGTMAAAPALVEGITHLTAFRGFAGTSILILVGCATDTARKVQAELVSQKYRTIELDDISAGGGGIPPPRWILGTTGSSVAAPTRRRSTRRDGAHRAHQVAPRALLAARTAPASMLHAEQVSAPFPPFPMPFRLAHACPPFPCLSALPMHFRLPHAFPPSPCLSALRMPFRLAHAFPPCACLSAFPMHSRLAHAFPPLLMPFSLPMPFPLCSCRSPCPCLSPSAHALPPLPMLCPVCSCRPFRHVREMAGEGVATSIELTNCRPRHVEDSKIDIGDFFKGDLPKKFLMLLGLLALSRVGIYIPLWGVDISAFQEQLGEGSFLATLDTLSGGGIGRLGLFSLGIVPYINAQIVFQLLGTLYPKIGDLQKKEGEAGRKKAQQYMKYMAVAFGALQEAERRFFYLPANVALIAFFNYFYTFLQLDPADVSDQLKRQGASVPNTRPGKATAALITKVLTRISVLGSAFLGTMAAAPALVEGITHLTAFRGFAGTSILILVGCATDTARKVQAELVSQKYRTIELDDISAGGGGIPPPRWILGTTGSSVAAPTRRRSTRRDGAHRAHQVAPRALLAARTAPASMLHAEQVSAPFPPFPMPFRLAHACPPFPCLSALPMHFRLPHAFPPSPCLSALRMPFRLAHAFPPCACLSAFPMHSRLAHAFPPLLMPFSLPMPFPLCSCRSPCPCLSPSAHALPPLPMLCPVCSCRPFRHVREMAGEGVATSIELTNCRPRHVEDSKIDIGDFFKGDLPKKFLMLLGLLALSRVGIYIPLWGVDISAFQEQLGEGSFLATLDTLSGGGIGRLGLFSLGIVPYINAQIVFQLLGTLYPKIGDLQKKEGEAGRKKAQQYMKYMAVAFGALQAIGQVAYLQQYAYDPSVAWAVSAVSGLTLGSVAVILLGDKITDLKLGNGTSLLIFTNIVSYLPASIGRTITEASEQGNVTGEALLLASFLLLVFGIVYVQEAERRIPINYASRYNIKTRNAYLPFKVNSTGVMPIIFSSSLLAAPYSIARFTGSAAFQSAATALYPGGFFYLPANVALIAFFNYFYTFLQLDPADVSDQLKRQGASVPNTRPGKATAALITKVLTRISVLGSAFLGTMAAAPALVEGITHLTAFRGFAGTSILILVGCATDTARKVQAELVSQKYRTIELDDISAGGGGIPPPRWILGTTGSSVAAPTRRRSTRRDGAHRAHQVAPRALLAARTAPASMLHAEQVSAPFPPFPMPFRLAHACPPFPCLSALPMHFRLPHAFPPSPCLSALRMPFRLAHAFPPCACLSAFPMHSRLAHAFPPLLMPFSLPMPFPLCSCRSPCPCLSPSAHALPPLPMLCPVCSCRPFRHVREMAGEGVATSIELTNCRPRHVEDSKIDIGDFFKGDLPKKFLMLLGLLALSRVGIYIPLWGVDISAFQEQLGEGSFLATLDTLSGGGIGRLGLFSLGIVPYINAQIVFQLLGTLYPKIGDLQKKEGEAGRKKAQQYMKYMAVAFGALQEAERRFFYLPANVALIAFFNYFYTFLQLDPADVSDQLKRQGASVPNTRPGKATAALITKVLTRISVLGSAFLGTMAAAPALVEGITHLTAFRGFAGTSILILVGCATDTARKVQAELVSQKYRTIELDDISAGGGGIPPPRWILGTTGSSVAAPTRRRSTRRDGAHRAHQVAPRALLAARTAPASMLHAEQVSAPFPPFPMPFRLAHACPPFPCLSALPMHFRLPHAFPPSPCLSALRMPFRLAHAFPPCACLSAFPMHSRLAHAFPPLLMPFSLPMPFPLCSCRSPCPCLSPSAHALPPLPMLCPVCSCRPFRHVREMAGEGVATSIELTNCRPRHVEDSKIDIGDFFKGDLPKKFLMLLGLLALSRVGIYIPLWGVDISAFQEQLGEGSFLATLDTLSGGGIGRLGLFSLGIVPYINAQIVFQLLGTLYPKIGDLQKKEGEAGRKKAQQYMKYMAVAFGALQEAERRFFYLPANVALIAFFNYFYTFLQLDPADVSDQLKRQGASVPNTRPGKATAALITKVLTRISVLGSAFLGTMAAAPALVEGITHLTAFRGFAGTSILILVGCATDTARKVQAELVSQKYRTIELDDISAGGGGIPPPRWILGTTGSSVAAPTRRRSTRRDGAHRAHQVAPRALLAARTAPASMLHAEQVSAPFPPFSHAFPPCACMSAFPLPFRLAHAFPPSPCLSAFPMPFRLAHAFPPCAWPLPPCACLSAFPMHSRLAHAFPPLLMPFSLPMPFPLCSCRSPCPCLSPSAHALPPLPMLCPVCSCRPFRHVREMAGEGVATSIELTNCRHDMCLLLSSPPCPAPHSTSPDPHFLFSSRPPLSPALPPVDLAQ
ncbi:unnamed protein product, partial [Closterium sp. Naga37s-1]